MRTVGNTQGPRTTAEAAADIRKRCEGRLDEMARLHMEKTGEGFYEAYAAVCNTPLGRSTIEIHDEAYRLQISN